MSEGAFAAMLGALLAFLTALGFLFVYGEVFPFFFALAISIVLFEISRRV